MDEKKLRAPPLDNLLRDYPSFELLWYDLQPHVRLIVEDLVEPVVHRITEYEEDIVCLRAEIPKVNARVDELNKVILETDAKLDVFEKIHLRLAELNAERKILEDHVNHEVKSLKSRMNEIDDARMRDAIIFKNIQNETEEVNDELSRLKETYKD